MRLLLCGLLLFCLGCGSSSVVGTWEGRMNLDTATLSTPATDRDRRLTRQLEKQMETARFGLEIRNDKTYSLIPPVIMNMKSKPEYGTWSQIEDKITLNPEGASGSATIPMELVMNEKGQLEGKVPGAGGTTLVFSKK